MTQPIPQNVHSSSFHERGREPQRTRPADGDLDPTYDKDKQPAAEERLAGTELAPCQPLAGTDLHDLPKQDGDGIILIVCARTCLREHQDGHLSQTGLRWPLLH